MFVDHVGANRASRRTVEGSKVGAAAAGCSVFKRLEEGCVHCQRVHLNSLFPDFRLLMHSGSNVLLI